MRHDFKSDIQKIFVALLIVSLLVPAVPSQAALPRDADELQMILKDAQVLSRAVTVEDRQVRQKIRTSVHQLLVDAHGLLNRPHATEKQQIADLFTMFTRYDQGFAGTQNDLSVAMDLIAEATLGFVDPQDDPEEQGAINPVPYRVNLEPRSDETTSQVLHLVQNERVAFTETCLTVAYLLSLRDAARDPKNLTPAQQKEFAIYEHDTRFSLVAKMVFTVPSAGAMSYLAYYLVSLAQEGGLALLAAGAGLGALFFAGETVRSGRNMRAKALYKTWADKNKNSLQERFINRLQAYVGTLKFSDIERFKVGDGVNVMRYAICGKSLISQKQDASTQVRVSATDTATTPAAVSEEAQTQEQVQQARNKNH